MFLSIIFLLASTKFVFNCADNAKGSDKIHPNFADYNSDKLFVELQEMTNSLSDAGGKAAEEMALVKGCHIIQKLQGNSTKYPKVVAEHSEFARLLQSVAKVCNEAKKDKSMFNCELIEMFAKNGPLILPQLKLKERQLLQELKNAEKDSELLETGGLVARLCLNVLPEGHPWKSALKELLGENVHLLPSDLLQFLISKMNSIAIVEQIEEKTLGPSIEARLRRIRRADPPCSPACCALQVIGWMLLLKEWFQKRHSTNKADEDLERGLTSLEAQLGNWIERKDVSTFMAKIAE
uniref:Uncharacterized protein n=1 Tax=Globodera rostochiensis TaxID=31243 RepID=A0A914GRX0_GLORO